MRASLIRHVDPWQDAARGGSYQGELGAARLPRLCAIATVSDALKVAISFAFDATKRGAVLIGLRVDGRIEMDCQRCLEPLMVELAVRNQVLVVRDDEAARVLDSSTEAIVSAPGERLELAELIEDELLLAMPFAPRHPAGECEVHPDADEGVSFAVERDDEPDRGGGDNDRCAGRRSGAVSGGKASAAPSIDDVASGDVEKENPFAVLATLRGGGQRGD